MARITYLETKRLLQFPLAPRRSSLKRSHLMTPTLTPFGMEKATVYAREQRLLQRLYGIFEEISEQTRRSA